MTGSGKEPGDMVSRSTHYHRVLARVSGVPSLARRISIERVGPSPDGQTRHTISSP